MRFMCAYVYVFYDFIFIFFRGVLISLFYFYFFRGVLLISLYVNMCACHMYF